MGANHPQVWPCQYEPKGYRLQRVGWIYVVNHYALLHTKYKSYWLHGFRRFFEVFPHYKEANDRPSGHGQIEPQRARLARFKALLYTKYIKALRVLVGTAALKLSNREVVS